MTGQANFLQSLGWAVLNSLWQLALLWVIYQIITIILKTAKSSFKSSLAFTFLIGGFGWFIFTFFTAYLSGEEKTVVTSAFVNADANEQVSVWLQQTLPVASIFYLALLILPLLHFIRNYRYVQVIRKYGLTKMNVEWRIFVSKVSAQLNIKQTVRIWVSEFVTSPVTIGFLKPVILVPLAAINHLTPQQLEAVLLHELSHIKRNDYLINLIINFIKVVLYFNPFVKAFVKIVERERETSCDEMVIQFQYNSHEYASALLLLEKANYDSNMFSVAAAGKRKDLLHRIELIMGVHKKDILSFNKLAGLMAGLLCIIAINCLLLMSKPETGNRVISFTQISPAFYLVEKNLPETKDITKTVEKPSQVTNHPKQTGYSPVDPTSFVSYASAAVSPDLINTSLELASSPDLKRYQEDQVEKTMLESKKVLENIQWKAIEKSIADVFNSKEKEGLKASYEKQMDKMDWNKWESKLKLAYDKIDWDKINSQLAYAVNQIRFDSIQMVYNKAMSKLEDASKELPLNNLKGIPDTDINLKAIEQKKAINELKAVRSKKIVHL